MTFYKPRAMDSLKLCTDMNACTPHPAHGRKHAHVRHRDVVRCIPLACMTIRSIRHTESCSMQHAHVGVQCSAWHMCAGATHTPRIW